MEKLIIVVAPVGAEVTRRDNPNLPITAEEIASEVKRCEEAGASVVHLHVRDNQGNPTQDAMCFREAIDAIKAAGCNVIIQVSTGGAVGMTDAERLQSIYSHEAVEMASLTTGTVNFGDDVFLNPPKQIEKFASEMLKMGIKPELECFDAGAVNNGLALFKKGLIKEPLHFDFVMGVPGGIPGNVRDLVYMVESLPPGATWQTAGIGRFQLPLAMCAIIMGGHVRVGFEDNIYYSRGRLAESNAELVERIVRIAGETGREVASPDEARRILGIGK
ncbi:MAG: 3-keto-5-aminohexanoate cleavage protein [Bacillota bacterium]